MEVIREPVDLLPVEMIMNILELIDIDDLLVCRLVCSKWQKLIDKFVFQEIAYKKNALANHGQGFFSFSQIDSNDIRKLELPWFVFYIICKHDPFNRNLVQNHCGREFFNHWEQETRSTYCASVKRSLLSSIVPVREHLKRSLYTWYFEFLFSSEFTLKQTIELKKYGLNGTVMKILQPEISFNAWYNFGSVQRYHYTLCATVYDDDNIPIETHNFDTDALRRIKHFKWNMASQSFRNKGNASHIVLRHTVENLETPLHEIENVLKVFGSILKIVLPITYKYSSES